LSFEECCSGRERKSETNKAQFSAAMWEGFPAKESLAAPITSLSDLS